MKSNDTNANTNRNRNHNRSYSISGNSGCGDGGGRVPVTTQGTSPSAQDIQEVLNFSKKISSSIKHICDNTNKSAKVLKRSRASHSRSKSSLNIRLTPPSSPPPATTTTAPLVTDADPDTTDNLLFSSKTLPPHTHKSNFTLLPFLYVFL